MDNFLQAIGAGALFGGAICMSWFMGLFLLTYFQFKKETEKKLETLTNNMIYIQQLLQQDQDPQGEKVISTESVPVSDNIQQKIGFNLSNRNGV